KIITQRTGWPSFGVLPFLPEVARLPAEDAVALDTMEASAGDIVIAVPQLKQIANFDDFDPLKQEPGVRLVFVPPGQTLPPEASLVILPGSKATISDLKFLRAQGWDVDLAAHLRRGGHVLGICGGYQMLGRSIADPGGLEGPAEAVEGLGLLAVDTVLTQAKTLTETDGFERFTGEPVRGYEMHVGETQGPDAARPLLRLSGRHDGAVTEDGRIAGCYLHGLFASDAFRAAYLSQLSGRSMAARNYEAGVDAALDALAVGIETHLDVDALIRAAR
ncbi:MAG: cobyric acid synthase CobQ, partial [Ferrovibrio sp.]